MVDHAQNVRVEAARLASQILAGSNADPERIVNLLVLLTQWMSPTPPLNGAVAPAPQAEATKPNNVIRMRVPGLNVVDDNDGPARA